MKEDFKDYLNYLIRHDEYFGTDSAYFEFKWFKETIQEKGRTTAEKERQERINKWKSQQ